MGNINDKDNEDETEIETIYGFDKLEYNRMYLTTSDEQVTDRNVFEMKWLLSKLDNGDTGYLLVKNGRKKSFFNWCIENMKMIGEDEDYNINKNEYEIIFKKISKHIESANITLKIIDIEDENKICLKNEYIVIDNFNDMSLKYIREMMSKNIEVLLISDQGDPDKWDEKIEEGVKSGKYKRCKIII